MKLASSSTLIGNLPCNSGSKSDGFASWNAPDAINKIWSVFIGPCFVFTVVPSIKGNRSLWQRDLLPLIEGTTVSTKHGPIKTDHILFIASGAFQLAKPSDLLPELQGRLPIRVELDVI